MQLFTFGLNHQTAPLDVRERVVFHAERLIQALHDLVDRRRVNEAAIISTCNRTEIYCNTDDPTQAVGWLAGYHRMKPQQLEPYLYHLPREQAVKHAFRVASGLDSMVLGEPQILGQFKEAVRPPKLPARWAALNKLFQKTFSVAKEVRTETEIGAHRSRWPPPLCSSPGASIPVAGQNVLFVGAGEMIELCAAHFAAQHPKHITFANRT